MTSYFCLFFVFYVEQLIQSRSWTGAFIRLLTVWISCGTFVPTTFMREFQMREEEEHVVVWSSLTVRHVFWWGQFRKRFLWRFLICCEFSLLYQINFAIWITSFFGGGSFQQLYGVTDSVMKQNVSRSPVSCNIWTKGCCNSCTFRYSKPTQQSLSITDDWLSVERLLRWFFISNLSNEFLPLFFLNLINSACNWCIHICMMSSALWHL